MILFPPAKVNLGLNVLYKRDDGYHEIKSCMAEIPLHDILEVLKADTFEFHQTGLTVDGDMESNLCVKAYRLMQERYDVGPVYLHLRKIIPMGAGLGGGSSDATYVLLALNELFELKLDDATLESLAAELGSDCAFFVRGGVQMSEGRGEVLRPMDISLEGYFMKLVYPSLHIGTAEAYENVVLNADVSGYESLVQKDFSGLVNSFEQHAFTKFPELKSIKQSLLDEGAFYAAMSGSGSSIFGLFREKPTQNDNENIWVVLM
ncbi:MAG: 4-(cytidine 5'-diphospho)-2-C-methyl-D-erythritol kinase [bacterium]|nr:4-(cytidine 5'-diphospho)-2-C-methyl-D-erythritol kinase [bacterium]